jgi:hypothetical protein
MKAIPNMLHVLTIIALFALVAHRPTQTNFGKISVEEFEMVDSQGTRRASIKIEDGGEIVFRMMDQQGTIRVKIGGDSDGSGLVLMDNESEPAIHILAKKERKAIAITVNGTRRDL